MTNDQKAEALIEAIGKDALRCGIKSEYADAYIVGWLKEMLKGEMDSNPQLVKAVETEISQLTRV